MDVVTVTEVLRASSVEEAVQHLAGLGDEGAPLAGGTWVMRSHLRGERLRRTYVMLAGLSELDELRDGDPTVIGALVTHAALASRLDAAGPLAALACAAATSAFPSVRNMATIGGNLCAEPFPEADLVPALLALDAEIEVASPEGRVRRRISEFLEHRGPRPAGELVASVHVPAPRDRRSGFERLTVRGGGEYALASVAVAADVDADGAVAAARFAVGSVEERPCRSPGAERVLVGHRLDGPALEAAGRAAAEELDGRDDVAGPGWYRLSVLPALARRVGDRLAAGHQ